MSLAISFIIPVYNVEPYLVECLNSINHQITSDIEMILVDDGSTDNSGRLCDTWAKEHPGTIVIHKKNGGLSSARNAGLDVAKGQYIAFVDSDDRIADGSVCAMIEWIRNKPADICFMNAIKFNANGERWPLGDKIDPDALRDKEKQAAMKYLAMRPKFPGSACTKIFSRSFLEQNDMRFPNDRRMHEDLYFTLQCIYLAQRYDALDVSYYEYRQGRDGSITQGSLDKSNRDLRRFISEMTEMYTVNRTPVNIDANYIMAFVAYEYSLALWKYCLLSVDQRKEAKELLNKYRWILAFNHTKQVTIIRAILPLFGISMTSKVINNYLVRNRK